MSFDGKVALVTGAARGIGRAIALALSGKGAEVLLADILLEPLKELQAELAQAGSMARVYTMDITSVESVAKAFWSIERDVKRVDLLINNAGITRDGLLVRMRDEDWHAVLDTNLSGTYRVTRAVLKGMMKARYGRIVNIASVVAEMGNAGQTNYAASKAGIIGFTKSLAREVASRGITVNAIAPGYIETAMTEALDEKAKEHLKDMIPAGRLGSPEDVANAALFLLSEESSYITGQVLHVGGGLYM
ncbi:MAG: 3-oxoacyl-[acyl-carrier-protein] reductase [Acidobacteriota bacterium]|nr:MAG: 3-oxoacyl-[acyl-carrier-protein] reductase [Acidobacteriota bacterium]